MQDNGSSKKDSGGAAKAQDTVLPTQDILAHIITPYIKKNHPDADMVLLAGSHASAALSGDTTPLATSDIDILVFYEDLQKALVNVATRVYEYIDNVPGVTGRLPMIDTNILDYESYHVMKDHFRKDWPCPFLYRMVETSYPVIDRSGRLPQLQADASSFVAAGPEKLSAAEMKVAVRDVQELVEAVREAPDKSRARLYGLMLFKAAINLDSTLHNDWINPAKAFRYFRQADPQRADGYNRDMALLLEKGQREPALHCAEAIIADGVATFSPRRSSAQAGQKGYMHLVTPSERQTIDNDLFRFLMFHTLESAETVKGRGAGEYYDNLASILDFTARTDNARAGYTPRNAVDGLDHLIAARPETVAIFTAALQGRIDRTMTDLCLDVAGSTDPRGFQKLQIDYPEDIGYRRYVGKISPASAANRFAHLKTPSQGKKKNP